MIPSQEISTAETATRPRSNVIPFPRAASGTGARAHRVGASRVCNPVDHPSWVRPAGAAHRKTRNSCRPPIDAFAPALLDGPFTADPPETILIDTRRTLDGVRVTITVYDGPPRRNKLAAEATFALGANQTTASVDMSANGAFCLGDGFRLAGTLSLLSRPDMPYQMIRFQGRAGAEASDITLLPGVVASL